MALYLGEHRVKINLDGIVYCLNVVSDRVLLLSSDNYILQDSNEIYLVPNDPTVVTSGILMLSSDGCVLKDSEGLYITTKEE